MKRKSTLRAAKAKDWTTIRVGGPIDPSIGTLIDVAPEVFEIRREALKQSANSQPIASQNDRES